MEKIAWLVLGTATLVCGIAAQWRPRALPLGRLALGVFYLFAGALVHVIYLAAGASYAGFADAAHVPFVRTAWHSVVAPRQTLVIGLLILFEAAVGVLVLLGGRAAQAGMAGILGMQAGLLLFGWVLTGFATVMLVAVGLLLRAQVHHDRAGARERLGPVGVTPPAAGFGRR
ncbi:MAG TPA: hypothetical protein VFH03_25300 [Actinoplanes sp.]|nr:hypothetical protein [Actinoplanes sp.]